VTEDRVSYVPEQASLLAISRILEETARMLHDWALAEDPPLRRPADPLSKKTLGWIADKCAGAAVGEAAKHALIQILRLFS
jgi:hypothetical protein